MRFWYWFKKFITLQAHYSCGEKVDGVPYMDVFCLPNNRWFNVKLRRINRDDLDSELHDHPSASLSLCLRGRATERYVQDGWGFNRLIRPGKVVFRFANLRHRMNPIGKRGFITLYVSFREWREWGYWLESGQFIPWLDFERQRRLDKKRKEAA